jgi:prevent-host-death family protein
MPGALCTPDGCSYIGYMASYSVRDAKNRLSALLARVRRGARIVITDRGVPVAMLVPPDDAGAHSPASAARLAGLVRAGLVVRRRQAASPVLLSAAPVVPSGGASAVEALLAERTEGR